MEAAMHEDAARFTPPPFAKGTGDSQVVCNRLYKLFLNRDNTTLVVFTPNWVIKFFDSKFDLDFRPTRSLFDITFLFLTMLYCFSRKPSATLRRPQTL